MPASSVAITAGSGTAIDTITAPNGDHRQIVIPSDRGGHTGRAATFRTPGRAGTAGQKIFSIFNAVGSTVVAEVHRITIDMTQTVAKAVTVLPPAIRVYKVTTLPTNGTALTKMSEDSGGTATSASVTVIGDASADGTSSGTALTSTLTTGSFFTQEFAPRILTAVGHETADRIELLESGGIKLRAGEGLVVMLDYVLATQNPVTDMWLVGVRWEEYTV